MLFRKKMEPSCSYCAHGTVVSDEQVACMKRGISSPWENCKKFKYDPLKRVPPAPQSLKMKGVSADDFSI